MTGGEEVDSSQQEPPTGSNGDENLPESLRARRRSIARAGRLHWLHWGVVALSLVATLTAWYVTKSQADEKVRTRFDREVERVVSLIDERMVKYEDGLWGGVAMVQASGGDVSLDQWVSFAHSLELDVKYPGINGIGVIHRVGPDEIDAYLQRQRKERPGFRVHPDHDGREYFPITYIEPAEPNMQAVGLDMAHEANRLTGLLRARDTARAQITGPIVLVQDAEHTPGFLLFAPFYEGGPPDTVWEREARFDGAVYAPFVVTELMHGVLDKELRHVGIEIRDGSEVVYDEHSEDFPDFDPAPMFTTEVALDMYGREWVFDIWTSTSFRDAASTSEPLTILIGGLALDGLLFALFVALSRSNRRALTFADDIAVELSKNHESLERSNAELERFAYVASHDLKTPLRGIRDLTDYLEEDLEEYLAGPDANPDVQKNLDRLRAQTRRMTALIGGILDYARIGADTSDSTEAVAMERLVAGLGVDVGLGPGQLIYDGPSTVVVPAAVYFEQVVQNLVTNAVKHHDDLPNAQVRVTATDGAEGVTVAVSDNGPGIDPQFHDRIFGVFKTLNANTRGTGIGLSIVRKIIDNQRGQMSVVSNVGDGATFRFVWPRPRRPAACSTPAEDGASMAEPAEGDLVDVS